MKYANKTTVSPERSRAEIEKTLLSYGATGFLYGWEDNRVVIQFKMKSRSIRYVQEMPQLSQFKNRQQWEQSVRQRWRSLAILIKGKLDGVENGTVEFEREFLSYIVMPNGRTVYEETAEIVNLAYLTGTMPIANLNGKRLIIQKSKSLRFGRARLTLRKIHALSNGRVSGT